MSDVLHAGKERSVFGDSPDEWPVDRIRDRLGPIGGGKWGDDVTAHDDGVEIPVIRVADIRGMDVASEDLTIRRVKASMLSGRLIGPRTLLIEKSGGGEQRMVGRTVLGRNIGFDAICSNFMAKTDCRDTLSPTFAAYLLHAAYTSGVNSAHVQQTTGIQNLRVTHYLNSKFAFPPPEEQDRIAAYLDASCAAIDAAVAAKQLQIETLDALAQEVLHRAFGHADWPRERIKDVALKIGSGVTPDGGAANYLTEGIPLLRSQNIHFDGLRLDDVAYISAETHAEMSNSRLMRGDVLLNITGASIGRCTYVPESLLEGNVNQHVCIIRGNHRIDHRFMTAFLSSPMGQGQVLSAFTGASRQGLSHKELGLIEIPLPSIDVQHQIVADIDLTKVRQRRLRDNISAQIDALGSYRKSLIHECVTGQRRVTEADLKRTQTHG